MEPSPIPTYQTLVWLKKGPISSEPNKDLSDCTDPIPPGPLSAQAPAQEESVGIAVPPALPKPLKFDQTTLGHCPTTCEDAESRAKSSNPTAGMSPNLLHLKSYLKLGSKVSGRDLGPSLGTATLRDARHRMTMVETEGDMAAT
jgi:hypothetical protein